MMDAKSGQQGFTDGVARNVSLDYDGRLYVIDDGERVSRTWIDPNRERDQRLIVAGSPS
jgi:hypothetical protein